MTDEYGMFVTGGQMVQCFTAAVRGVQKFRHEVAVENPSQDMLAQAAYFLSKQGIRKNKDYGASERYMEVMFCFRRQQDAMMFKLWSEGVG